MADVSLRAASKEHFLMGQDRSSQDAANVIRLTDRVIEKFIRRPPVGILWRWRNGLLPCHLFPHSPFSNMAPDWPI